MTTSTFLLTTSTLRYTVNLDLANKGSKIWEDNVKQILCMSVLAFLAAATNLQAESINVLVEGGGEQLQKDIAAKFTKDTGVDVKFTVVPYQGVFDKLSASMASGKSDYDVATIDVVWNAKFADKVENLDSLFTPEVVADLPAALLADAKFGGHYIGMPG